MRAKGPRAIDLDRLWALIAAQDGNRPTAPPNDDPEPAEPEAVALPACPCCGGRMRIIEIFGRGRTPRAATIFRLWLDTS